MQFEGLAAHLAADILTPDLRSFWGDPLRRGDSDPIGQFLNDLPDAYAPLMQLLTAQGQYQIIPDTGHLALVDHPQTALAIAQWLNNVP